MLKEGDLFNGLTYFAYEHLPPPLQAASKPFCELAKELTGRALQSFEDGELSEEQIHEVQKSLDHLLYAKDAAVRAALPPHVPRI